MGDTRLEFYKALWNDSDLYRSIWYGEKGKPPNKSKWFKTTEQTLIFISSLDITRFNVYHACSLFNKPTRKQQFVEQVKAFWLDLDIKNTTCTSLKQLAITFLPFFKTFKLGSNYWIIKTGNGFHLYWMLDNPLSKDEWQHTAKQLSMFCKEHNIPHERETDSASLLRVPDSWNLKGVKPKQIKVIRKSHLISTLTDFVVKEEKFEKNKDIKFNKEDFNLNYELSNINQVESDANIVADKCPLIAQFRKDGLDESEPFWHLALGVVYNCKDGEKIAHEFSSKSPRYNEQETTNKLIALESNNIGPCLCETFESYGCTYCATCSHKGKIKSPIQLGAIFHNITDDLDDLSNNKQKQRAMKLIKLAPNKTWIIKKEGIYKIVDDIPVIVCRIPFYVIDKFCEDVNDLTIITALIRAFTKIGVITFKLPLKIISEDRKLLGEFNARSIFPFNKKYFKEYLTTYLQNISHIKPIKAVNSLGWQLDNSFVYSSNGNSFSKNGDPLTCIIDTKAVGYIKGFASKGNLEEWGKVIDIYRSNELFCPHLFSLLCSLGAPLLPMTSVKGFILSLQGESGSGKTISQEYALSVWGDPETAGNIGTKDTNTSMLGRLGAVKNLPLRLDEATTLSAAKLSGLIYELVNGRGRARATIDGSLSNTAFEWQTLTLVTTNRPLLEQDTSQITEAERYRILELEVKMPPDMMDVGDKIGTAMKNNYGLAGKIFIKWVMENKNYTQRVLDYFFDKFKIHVDDSKRFWVSCGAIAFAAATIANKIGLFELKIADLYKWFIDIIKDQTALNNAFIIESRGFESKEELVYALRDNLGGHILTINSDGTTIIEPSREVKAIIKQLDSGRAKLYVRGPILNEFIKTHFTNSVEKVKADLKIEDSKTERVGSRVGRFYNFDLFTS